MREAHEPRLGLRGSIERSRRMAGPEPPNGGARGMPKRMRRCWRLAVAAVTRCAMDGRALRRPGSVAGLAGRVAARRPLVGVRQIPESESGALR